MLKTAQRVVIGHQKSEIQDGVAGKGMVNRNGPAVALKCLPPSPPSSRGTTGHHVIRRNLHWNEGWMFHVWLIWGFSNTREQIKFRAVVERLEQQIKRLRSSSGLNGNWHNTVSGWTDSASVSRPRIQQSYCCAHMSRAVEKGVNQPGLHFSDACHRCPWISENKRTNVFNFCRSARRQRREWPATLPRSTGHSLKDGGSNV